MKVLLKVPYSKQISKEASLSACVEMSLKYQGYTTSQGEIFESSKWSGNNGRAATDAGIAITLKDKGFRLISWWNDNPLAPIEQRRFNDTNYWPQFWTAAKLGVLERRENAGLHTIKGLIDKGVPVVADIDFTKLTGSSAGKYHNILIVGYSDRHFIYHDPADSEDSGPNKRMLQKKFEDLWAKAQIEKAISVVVKKDQKMADV